MKEGVLLIPQPFVQRRCIAIKRLSTILIVLLLLPACGNKAPSGQIADDSIFVEEQTEPWHEDATQFIEEVEDELILKGWSNVECINAEIDSSELDSSTMKNDEGDSLLYTISGQTDGMYDNPITVTIKIIFDNQAQEWKRQEVFYASEAGRFMGENDLDTDEILNADDEALWDYMYSY